MDAIKEFEYPMLNQTIDVSKDFVRQENNYFIATKMLDFDCNLKRGFLECKRYARKIRMCFNHMSIPFEETQPWEYPPKYDKDMKLPFSVSFVTPRIFRIQLSARKQIIEEKSSIMLSSEPKTDETWKSYKSDNSTIYSNSFGSIEIKYDLFNIVIRDANGRLLTNTQNIMDTKNLENSEPTLFSILRCSSDMKRRIAASFSLSPDEKIFGGRESFTRINKRDQKIVLYTTDVFGVQTQKMYKPIPFFISSKDYGMFVHTS
ncbi:MAG TPA: hypothetical protein VIK78_18875 [Ruminiclostridium sp.]